MGALRPARVFAVVLVLLGGACGGNGGKAHEVEQAVQDYLLADNVQLNVGLNPNGVIVAVSRQAADYFADPTRTIDSVKAEDVKIKGDTATAKASFLLQTTSDALGCESGVVLTRREGAWQPIAFTISSCL